MESCYIYSLSAFFHLIFWGNIQFIKIVPKCVHGCINLASAGRPGRAGAGLNVRLPSRTRQLHPHRRLRIDALTGSQHPASRPLHLPGGSAPLANGGHAVMCAGNGSLQPRRGRGSKSPKTTRNADPRLQPVQGRGGAWWSQTLLCLNFQAPRHLTNRRPNILKPNPKIISRLRKSHVPLHDHVP